MYFTFKYSNRAVVNLTKGLIFYTSIICMQNGCSIKKCDNEIFFQHLRQDHIKKIEQCITSGVDLNYRNEIGQTPLSIAISSGDIQLVRYLVTKGADPFSYSPEHTPLIKWVASKDQFDLVILLKTIQLNQWNNGKEGMYNEEHLTSAIEHDNDLILHLFLKEGERFNEKNANGMTPIAQATFEGSTEVAKLLLKNGIHPDSEFDTRSILSIASMFGYTELVKIIIEHGADIDNYDGTHTTALMFAAENNHPDIVKILLESGANVTMKDNANKTANDKADELGYHSISKLLSSWKPERNI